MTTLALGTTLIVLVVVFGVGPRNVLADAERVVAIVSGMLFTLLAVGLYRGARLRRDEPSPTVRFGEVSAGDYVPDGLGGDLSIGDDLLGALLGIVAWVVLGLALIFLLPLILNGLVFVVSLIAVCGFWVTRHALRRVFARGPSCRGKPWRSLGYAAQYTLLYAGWLLAILVTLEMTHSGSGR